LCFLDLIFYVFLYVVYFLRLQLFLRFIASSRYIFKNWFLWAYFEKLQFIDKTGFPPTAIRLSAFCLRFWRKRRTSLMCKVSRINSQLKLQSVSPDWRDSLVPILTKLVIIWGPMLLYCHFKNKELKGIRPSNITRYIHQQRPIRSQDSAHIYNEVLMRSI
jgi:hypothetical protein